MNRIKLLTVFIALILLLGACTPHKEKWHKETLRIEYIDGYTDTVEIETNGEDECPKIGTDNGSYYLNIHFNYAVDKPRIIPGVIRFKRLK